MSDVWPTDEMLTQACLAAQPFEHATIGLAHVVARATVAAAPTVDPDWDGVWCGTQFADGARAVSVSVHCRPGGSCPGPHHELIVGPATDGDADG